jgi:hypothetical protein
MEQGTSLGRRKFTYFFASAMAGLGFQRRLPVVSAAERETPPRVADNLPQLPKEAPLDWRARAEAFDHYVMDRKNRVLQTRPDGTLYFASALEGTGDGGLTTFAPIALGKILRGDPVEFLLPSMAAYFSEDHGIFLDGTNAELCEYWYLMNVNALVDGIVRSSLSHDSAWTARVRRSADRMLDLGHQIAYNFNDQGYLFDKAVPFTHQDIYRQPDAIGGYAYTMLFAYEMFGAPQYLAEAKKAISLYQSFAKNPWYEIPSGAMACLAAARLSVQEPSAAGSEIDLQKILGFALTPNGHPLQTGEWGEKEVNGLMAGFCTEPEGQAYSMESLMPLLYLLPVLRYRPEFGSVIGKYVLHTSANMRLFYADCIPRENQSRPDLTAAVPYERLTKEVDGHSPFASGDYGSHRSIYGGAYALMWGELVKPTEDEQILQLHVSRSDFLCSGAFASYLYYNPRDESKRITLKLEEGDFDIFDLMEHRFVSKRQRHEVSLSIPSNAARIVVVVPSGTHLTVVQGRLLGNGLPIDYRHHA